MTGKGRIMDKPPKKSKLDWRSPRSWLFRLVISISILAMAYTIYHLSTMTSEELPSQQILARVNGERILVEDFYREYYLKRPQTEESAKEGNKGEFELKKKILNQLIQHVLLLQEAKNRNLQISEQDLKKHLARVKRNFSGAEFTHKLTEMKLTENQWIQMEKEGLLIDQLYKGQIAKKVDISEEELRDYYEKNLDKFRVPEQVRARQIVVATEAEAHKIRKKFRWRRERQKFAEYAQEYSLSPEAKKGGDVGFYSKGVLPEVFDRVFELKEGEISDVIESEYGFHIFQLEEKRESHQLSFDEVRQEIMSQLKKEKENHFYEKWLNDLISKSRIVKYERRLRKI